MLLADVKELLKEGDTLLLKHEKENIYKTAYLWEYVLRKESSGVW